MKTKLVNGFGIRQGWNMQKYNGRIKQGPHPGSAVVKGKTLLNRVFIIHLVVALSLSAFAPMGEAQSQSDLGGCSVTVDGSKLSIIGTEAPNTIHVAGSERGIQVTCDGASDTFTGIEEIMVEGRDGDDNVTIDDSNGLLGGLAINVFSQGRADLVLVVILSMLPLFEVIGITFVGAFGPDVLQIAAGPLADSFDITPGREANSVEVQVTDIASGRQVANITGSKLEDLTVQMGEGDDEANISPLPGITTNIFGGGGNDSVWDHEYEFRPGLSTQQDHDFNGGIGVDALKITSGALADRFDIAPGTEANSVEVRVTDIASETPLANITGSALEVLTVEMGEGDDQANVSQLPGIALKILGQGGDDHGSASVYPLVNLREPSSTFFELGPGFDALRILSGARDDQFDVRRGEAEDAVAVQVTDITTQTPVANILAAAVELTSIKMGAGDDILNKFGSLPTVLSVFGEDGDDQLSNTKNIGLAPMMEIQEYIEGGTGHDKFSYQGTTASEQYEIAGVPDLTIPDPELRVTDMVTGLQFAHVQFLDVEDVTIEAGDGDDRVEVNWDAALMSGLSLIHADLGRGNDSFLTNLLPVLTEPATREVQTAQFDVDAGPGNDQIAFDHSAGSWFDVFFTADTGPGADTVNALLKPPPDDGIPGPEGLRQLQFNVVTGGNDDFVGLENQTSGETFNVLLYAGLEGGNDTFEGRGGIHDANILPGRGFDTARVTPNFRPFVGDFERVEILE